MAGIITSIPPLVEQPPGNNASNPAGLPGITYSAAIPILPQTWTGLQTYTLNSIQFAGSTSGNTFLNATAIASGTLTLPAATDTLVARNTVDTLTNKTLTNPVINGAAIAGSSIAIHSTGTGNFDLSLLNSENLTAGRSLTLTTNDASRTLNMGGNITTAGALTTSGAFASTFTMTGTTTVTFPTTGTLATLAGAETLSNKTLPSPAITTPTGIIKSDVGLGNVDNTSDATKNSAVATLTNKTIDTAGPNTIKINGNTLSATAGTATVTVPNSTTQLVGRDTTDTLTNKSIVATQLTGTLQAAQFPALTGDITTTAGTVATAIGANKVTNAMRAQMAAWTLKGNATAATANEADIDVTALTLKASPVSGDIVLIQDSAASNAFKRTTVGALASAGSVASFNTLTGAVTTSVVVQKFTASGTYTPTAGMLHAIIECVGGGGAGGGALGVTGGLKSGHGGNSGGYSRKYVTAAAVGASQTVTIGAGGNPGTAGDNAGNAGGDTSVGTLCIAKGGPGGTNGTADQAAGAIAGTGDIASPGNIGSPGMNSTINTFNPVLGAGAPSAIAGGPKGQIATSNAVGVSAAANTGAGGGGAVFNSSGGSTAFGGSGGSGIVIITEYVNL